MSTILAIVLGVHLSNKPPGMPKWRFLWRCFAIKFYWHKRTVVTRGGDSFDRWTVRCDDLDMGCIDGCRRQKKLREWEERDRMKALPEARLL